LPGAGGTIRPVLLAERMGRVGESATLRASRLASELRAQGIEVVDFGVGEPDFPSPPVAVEAARQALADGFTKYTDGSGTRELRQAVADSLARRYGGPWAGGDVVITVGAKMALFQLALALFDPGDEVVLPSPCWVSFPEQIRFAGARPVPVPTAGEDGFRIHAEPLVAAFNDRTRAVLINSPTNPTGGVIGAADLRRLVEACAARGIPLISDETYDRFHYDGLAHASAASLAAEFPETVVLVGSFSKTYAMTGWRLGYLCASPPLVKAVATIQSHSTSNPTSFAMKGALAALAGAEADVERMIAAFQQRRDLLIAGLNDLPGFVCRPPAGAFYAFPEVSACYRPGMEGSMAFSEFLLEKAGVAVVPGIAFGSDRHVRISFACSGDTLRRGLERLAGVLALPVAGG
jgi:aspartate aminotransferase